MFKIVEARFLSADVKMFRLFAPRIARKQKPGQFVILRANDHGERIPITIAGSNEFDGTVTVIIQGIGKTTKLINLLETGDFILDVVGPLGKPSHIMNYGKVVVVGGGVGTAIAYPIAKALHEAGNHVTTIVGAKTRDLLILEDEMRSVCDCYYPTTDDGTYGDKGMVTDKLRSLIASDSAINYVLAIGPIPMMAAVAETTRPAKIETVVSLNAVMVDGTGMCGGCRVSIAGKSAFACVDGPEFDAHLVDFKSLGQRSAMYQEMEQASLARFQSAFAEPVKENNHRCRLTGDERLTNLDAACSA
jgi:ferredoxin--NADP+ reductase